MDRVQKSKLSLYKKTMEVNRRALEQASSDLGPLCVSACWRLCWMSKPFGVLEKGQKDSPIHSSP